MKDSTPPLLRGVGMLLMTIAAAIALCIARMHGPARGAGSPGNPSTGVRATGSDLAALASEVHELRAELEQESVVEEVLDNRWFDWIGVGGTAVFAASFFAEAYLRREKSKSIATVARG